MPTHDYIIDNGTGAAVRADINLALSAIVSLNSSASEPGTMYAYQLWADTGSNPSLLKIRNGANSGWITLRQLDGDFSIVAVEDGLQATPSLTFTNDLNTGIFRPGNDSLAIVTGATRAITITSTQAVGIQTANPSTALHVAGNARVGADDVTDAHLQIGKGATGNRNSYIDIVADTTYTDYGLRVIRNNTGANATSELKHRGTGALNFTTEEAAPIVFNTTNSPALTITSGGLVGIGNSGPSSKLDVTVPVNIPSSGSPDAGSFITARGNTATVGYGPSFSLSNSSGAKETSWRISAVTASGNNGDLVFNGYNGGADLPERMRITAGGLVGIGTTAPTVPLSFSTAAGQKIDLYSDSTLGNEFGFGIESSELRICAGTSSFIGFRTGGYAGSERARIDSSGRLLVGTTSNANGGQVEAKTATVEGGNPAYDKKAFIAQIPYATTNITSSLLAGFDSNIHGVDLGYRYNGTGYDLCFATNSTTTGSPTERMRINSNGHTKFTTDGSYTGIDANTHGFRQTVTANWTLFNINSSASPTGIVMDYAGAAPNSTSNFFLYCSDTSAVRANIRSNGGLANFQSNDVNLSDRNVKKDISPAANTWNCIKEWEIVNYRYKDQPDDANLNVGVIAQQVAESCPEVITVFQEAKEATEDKPAQEERLGVREQQMYWMAIKALQEAMGRIEALETEVALLKAA